MWRVVGRRALSLAPVLIAVSFLTFLLLSLLPGDPAVQILGPQNVSPEGLAQVREELGLDRPLPMRYLSWLGDTLSGDLGRSYQTRQRVTAAIAERLPITIELVGLAMLFSLVVAIPLGVLSAYRANTRLDAGITGATFGLLSLPNFMLALLLIFFFSVRWNIFPATGWTRLTTAGSWTDLNLARNLRGAVLPALSLGVANVAVFTRLLRTDMISTLQEEYVLVARAKGLPTWRILFLHALRPSSFSLMTVAGVQMGVLLSGTVVIEEIFALPGVGRLLFQSIVQRDLLIVQGVVLIVATGFVFVNFVVDILYSFLDPRIRVGGGRATA